MSDAEAVVETAGRRLSAIWVVPLVAVLVGIWLAVDAYLSQGPTVTLTFSSADGIEQDKTRIRARSVEVGIVSDVQLNEELDGVIVTADLYPEAETLLRDDTQFWVVRPTIRGANVTGLGTLLSGAYIEVSPGIGPVSGKRDFDGLDSIPAAPAGTPGIRLRMISESSGAVGEGSPILFQGLQVGIVESRELDIDTHELQYSLFIDAPFDQLVTSNTRFWNTSGISAELGAEGFKFSIGSLLSALVGGISFDLPRNSPPGNQVTEGMVFRLYPNEASVHEDPYSSHIEYVVFFEQSLRGLRPGSEVVYRGLTIGSVERIMVQEMGLSVEASGSGEPWPVLIRIEPGRMELGDNEEGVELAREIVEIAVSNGLRATVGTGNFLTGSMYIGLDIYDDVEEAGLGSFLGYPTIPSIRGGGLGRIQTQISALLDKLNDLPLEDIVASAGQAIIELQGTLAAARVMLERDQMQQLPADLHQTLAQVNDALTGFSSDSVFQQELVRMLVELKETLQGAQGVTDQLNDSPNSFVFPTGKIDDPLPRAPRP